MHIQSPITGSSNVVLEKEIPRSSIIGVYNEELDIDVARFFRGIEKIGLYHCLDTGYRFFYPFDITGDNAFYQELQKFPWYYMDEKWEHAVAAEYIKEGDNVLEIGCARGGFLKKMKSRGTVPEGLEMNSDALAECRKSGLSVYTDSIESFSKRRTSYYDAVCSFQVLEHVSQVRSFIDSSLACLKSGGSMIVSVPNDDAGVITLADGILNMPPHHMGRWNMNSFFQLQHHFGITLEAIHLEPLQPYHLGFALRIANKKVMEKLHEKIGIFASLIEPIARRFVYAGVDAIRENIIGHSILAIFKKR